MASGEYQVGGRGEEAVVPHPRARQLPMPATLEIPEIRSVLIKELALVPPAPSGVS